MRTSRGLTHISLLLLSLFLLCASGLNRALAAEPGLPFPASSAVSDQKAGSLLVYNVYTSSITNFNGQNSRLTMTNTSATTEAFVHLFFVDGSTCSVADLFLCLTPNQTATMLASDFDPGITGYLVAIAVDGRAGCPVSHNFLIGDAHVKFPTGHTGNLAAEAFAAQFDAFAGCGAASSTATLFFDQPGTPDSYNSLPRVLAVDNIPDRTSGNSTLLIINRIGGNLATTASTIGSIFGLLYDDAENAYSFTFASGACQFRGALSNSFPRTAPRFETVIPAGRSGWMKLWGDNPAVGLLGATINSNSNSGNTANAFNGAHNLHKLTLNNTGAGTTAAPSITIPVFPPSC